MTPQGITPSGFLIRGGTVLTMDDEGRELRADVRVQGALITEVGSNLEALDGERVIAADDCVVLPGFVHTHTHLCQTLFRNLADDMSLLQWLQERIWPLEASHTEETLSVSARLGLSELIRGGATGIVDMGTVHHTEAIFEAIRDAGIRAIAGKCMMDAPDTPAGLKESTEASLRESEALASRWDGAAGGLIRYGYAPRFVLSCTDALMREVGDAARSQGLWMHTHASENLDEIALVNARSGGLGNVAYLDRLGMSGPKTVIAHCVHLQEGELSCLAEHGTRVSHCPSSNLKLASGVADVAAQLEGGVHVSLGADGAPCNNRLDMFTEMRTAALLQKLRHGPRALPAARVLRMATRDGAEAMGGGESVGQIRSGFRADLQILRLDDVLSGPGGSLSSRIVYACTRSCVRSVMVDGRFLMEDGAVKAFDQERLAADARHALSDCVDRAGL